MTTETKARGVISIKHIGTKEGGESELIQLSFSS